MTNLRLFDSDQGLAGLGISPPPMQEEWRPNLQWVTMSGGGSRLATARPSLLGVASSWPVASTTTVAAVVMAVIPVVIAEVGSEVNLAIRPPIAVEGERRETGHPASHDGGAHSLSSWSELEGSGGDAARPEVEHLWQAVESRR